MQIRNRIEKLEKLIIMPDSEFCDCFDIHFRKLIDKVYDGTAYDENAASLPDGDYCHKCKKPVNPRTIDYIEKINKIYGDDSVFELLQKPVAVKNL